MAKWLILGLGQKIYKMSLEHLVLTEVRKNSKQNKILTNNIVKGSVKGTQKPIEKAPSGQSWDNLSKRIKKKKYLIVTQNIK